MKKYFCSSDIHSFFRYWQHALQKAGFDMNNKEHNVIICGDLFDRGDETIECYQFVKQLAEEGRLVYVKGNHEELLKDCVDEILTFGRVKHQHHVGNGTVKTLSHILGGTEYDLLCGCFDTKQFEEKTKELLKFIEDNTVDYFELNSFVFVHGWIPSYAHVEDYHVASEKDWSYARWENGMEMHHNANCRPEGKTVVVGHWHCSWGWSHIDHLYKEFPPRPHPDFKKTFLPWRKDGIIAIDACTAYSNKVNVVVFNEQGEEVT